jgi:hypothetical protein
MPGTAETVGSKAASLLTNCHTGAHSSHPRKACRFADAALPVGPQSILLVNSEMQHAPSFPGEPVRWIHLFLRLFCIDEQETDGLEYS